MNEKNKQINISTEWSKAQRAFKAAQILLDKDLPDESIARAYYAAFHAVKALLLTEGLEARSHQGVGSLFSLHFVRAGKIDSHYSRVLSRAQKEREEADYLSSYVFTEEDATQRLSEVKQFLSVVEKLLQQSGYKVTV